jgi:hypothetical protein
MLPNIFFELNIILQNFKYKVETYVYLLSKSRIIIVLTLNRRRESSFSSSS